MRSDRLQHVFGSVFSRIKRYRMLLLTLSAVVVFVVSYLLVLPALTLEKDEAAKQGGISLQTESSEAGTNPTDASEANQITQTQEKSDKSDEKAAEKKSDKNDKQKASSAKTPVFKAGELSYEGKAYDIKASYQKEAEIPEQTELQVEEITKKNEKYDQYYKKALEGVQEDTGKKTASKFSFAKFYDISLNADGSEVEPADKMRVTISYDQGMPAEDADHIKIIHFVEDEKTGEITPEVLDQKDTDFTVKKEK